jgi:hypothetical protein
MILRRFSQALREQNWTAISIEFVLLVAGVFFGIQVSNWNDERREQALEAVYLDRIADNVRSDVQELDELLRVSTTRMAVLSSVLREATGRDLPSGFDSARGRVAIEEVSRLADDSPVSASFALFILTTLDGNRSAYSTLINSGGIGQMRDAAMLAKVQRYYALVDQAFHFEIGLEQNRDKLVDAERRVGISPMDERSISELASAFAADRELLATAQNYWLYTNRHIKLMRDLQQRAKALVADIEQRAANAVSEP